jgi:hypothetical protein
MNHFGALHRPDGEGGVGRRRIEGADEQGLAWSGAAGTPDYFPDKGGDRLLAHRGNRHVKA